MYLIHWNTGYEDNNEYELYLDGDKAMAEIEAYVRSNWKRVWHKKCPENLTTDQIWDFFYEADEYCRLEQIEPEDA